MYKRQDKLRVKRQFDGVLGTAHTSASLITNLNRTIVFNLGINTDKQTRVNIPYYFNPIESVALGESAGVGIGSTVRYSFRVVVVRLQKDLFQLKIYSYKIMDSKLVRSFYIQVTLALHYKYQMV